MLDEALHECDQYDAALSEIASVGAMSDGLRSMARRIARRRQALAGAAKSYGRLFKQLNELGLITIMQINCN